MTSRVAWRVAALLAGIAGSVDATLDLHFGHLSVSFMSGNSTSLGVSVAQGDRSGAWTVGLPMALFVAGSFLGALVAQAAGRRVLTAVLLGEMLLLGTAWLLPHPATRTSPALLPLVLAMGMQNAALTHVGGASVGVTYVTGTLAYVRGQLAALLLPAAALGVLALWGLFVATGDATPDRGAP